MDDAWHHARSTYRSKQHRFILKARNFRGALVRLIELVSQCNDCETQNNFALEAGVSFDAFYRDLMPSG
jgi:hypothetical protein